MIELNTIKHHIGRSIIAHLQTHEHARFSDMRPSDVDTNLFTYHLKILMKAGYIAKTDIGYTLGQKGLVYADRVSTDKMRLRSQPKIITMLLVQNSDGRLLLQQRQKQPYIATWTLPYGKLHIDDESVPLAAIRESEEKLHFTPPSVRHVGDCYIVTRQKVGESYVQSRTLVHVARFETDTIEANKSLQWVKPLSLASLKLAPAVEQIVARAFFNDAFFFEEFHIDLQ